MTPKKWRSAKKYSIYWLTYERERERERKKKRGREMENEL